MHKKCGEFKFPFEFNMIREGYKLCRVENSSDTGLPRHKSCSPFFTQMHILSGFPEFKNSKQVPFSSRKYIHFIVFLLTLPSVFYRSEETVQFSTALISKSQVETYPAEGLLDSLSHSSLTHKQLVTHAAIFFSPARLIFINATIHM